eukprot:270910-Rhodomonas_salina.1
MFAACTASPQPPSKDWKEISTLKTTNRELEAENHRVCVQYELLTEMNHRNLGIISRFKTIIYFQRQDITCLKRKLIETEQKCPIAPPLPLEVSTAARASC